ncbi:hypothetical protein ACJIZ3_025349 [Penstemon smallii]|uniref:Uncharacterized protein n=1 Tax=Penstemon smallii TaxID=265156 RepID=A0ABD3TWL0_9LAMI
MFTRMIKHCTKMVQSDNSNGNSSNHTNLRSSTNSPVHSGKSNYPTSTRSIIQSPHCGLSYPQLASQSSSRSPTQKPNHIQTRPQKFPQCTFSA